VGVISRADILAVSGGSDDVSVMTVGSTDVHTIDPDDSLADAAEKMIAHGVGRLPVVARDGDGTLLGLLTRREILIARSA
jgi:CIC family chloride channel protein